MLAKKENRLLQIEASEKEALKADGYDIVEFDDKSGQYKIIERATGGKNYSVAQYAELQEQNQKLEARIKQLEKEIKASKKE
ncbi:hypothetical protein [Lactococcus lactis]|uniref:Uncharacterized protein n=1 Tax=Lactococcus lactis TaxID=1358 RepID=A0AAW5TQ24_9LACT|nr:hypothetical protein [Lactococcus lactis]MCW2281415.1 hypothetical protein [Lactococcus lactis]MCW2281445.1 hypothetical protein [Lactococcus lactis]MCW2282179.1 hypothetical protein [Lactococcus lactis]